MENLKTHKKLGIVQATGTGKGKLASCFVEHVLKRKPNAKILILAPLNSILQNYREAFGLSIDIATYETYQKLPYLDNDFLLSLGLDYDLIIVDEFHRLGATKWFKCIKRIFEGVNNPKSHCYVIGFTATPIRYLDNARDMGVELFEGNIIQGVNLEDAICEGILPGFVYNACYFDTEDSLGEVEKKLASNDYNIVDDTIRNDLMVKVRELKMLYHNKLKIENILKETTKDLGATQKWIIFCRDKESLAEIRKVCGTWFISKPKMYIVHSDKTLEDNSRILKEFRNANSGVNVMLCIDMLNEGVHIKDISGVILLRKTDSPIIFLQQLGRALEAGKTTQPLIYDLVGNYKGLKIEVGGLARNPLAIVKSLEEKTIRSGKTNYVIVHNFTEAIDTVMAELSNFIHGAWSDAELEILKTYYPEGGSVVCIEKGINRPADAIRRRANQMGITRTNIADVWSSEEDAIIKQYYPEGGYKACIEAGLDRQKGAILTRAATLKVNKVYDYWSEDEINIVKTYYKIGGVKMCKEHGLTKDTNQIYACAKRLGLKTEMYCWPDEDMTLLKQYYPLGGSKLCIEKGLNKSVREIVQKAKAMGISSGIYWTDEEFELLKTYYPLGGSKLCIEKGLNKTASQIHSRASQHKLKFDNSWSDAELDILRTYYLIGGWKLCQEKGLNRTQATIIHRAAEIGIAKTLVDWTPEDVLILQQYYPLGGSKLCKEKGLNKSDGSIRSYARTHGIKFLRDDFWADEEIELLKTYFPVGGSKLCIEKGLNRSEYSIRTFAHKHNISGPDTAWSESDMSILKEYYPIGGYKLCVEKGLSRNRTSTVGMASKLGLTQQALWSPEEDAIISKYFPEGGAEACIQNGLSYRTAGAIQRRAYVSGIKKGSRAWSIDEEELLKKYYPVGGYKLCVEKGLNRSEHSMKCYAQKKGINSPNKDTKLKWADAELNILYSFFPVGGASLCKENGLSKRSLEAIRKKASELGLVYNN